MLQSSHSYILKFVYLVASKTKDLQSGLYQEEEFSSGSEQICTEASLEIHIT